MSTVLALMLAQAPSWGEQEAPGDRYGRLEIIAAAASVEAAHPPDGWRWSSLHLTAALLATSYEEGWRWSEAVHSGEKLGDGTRARCLNQLHKHPTWVPGPMWRASTGTDFDATRLCMRGAARVLAHYADRCVSAHGARDFEGSMARVVAGYGTGKTCSPDGRDWAVKRARRVARWFAELEAA